jgi:hypothetical protein
MNVVLEEGRISGEALAKEMMAATDASSVNVSEPFRIHVPAAGVHYAFEMLYANHGELEAHVRVPYASRGGVVLGQMASLLGVWILYVAVRLRLAKRARIAAGSLGAALALAPIAIYGVSPLPALGLAGALAVFSLRHELKRGVERIRAAKTVAENG